MIFRRTAGLIDRPLDYDREVDVDVTNSAVDWHAQRRLFLESNNRKTWELQGPFCEGWPVYHVIHDPKSDAVYAAAASEWHGQAIWRSGDRGETWTHSSEGIAYDAESGRKVSKVSTLAVSDSRLLVGVEAPRIFQSSDEGQAWSLLSNPGRRTGKRGVGRSFGWAAR